MLCLFSLLFFFFYHVSNIYLSVNYTQVQKKICNLIFYFFLLLQGILYLIRFFFLEFLYTCLKSMKSPYTENILYLQFCSMCVHTNKSVQTKICFLSKILPKCSTTRGYESFLLHFSFFRGKIFTHKYDFYSMYIAYVYIEHTHSTIENGIFAFRYFIDHIDAYIFVCTDNLYY